MVELIGHGDILPAAGVMARLTRGLEFSPVRVGVAVHAGAKLESGELCGVARARGNVAFFAAHFQMQSRQRVFGFGVIELRSLLPVDKVMAPLAIRPQITFVRVLMARDAVL